MKILVPTDFSEFAEYAAQAAVRLLDAQGGELHFFHAQQIDKSLLKIVESSYKNRLIESIEKESKEQLAQKLEEYESHKNFKVFVHYTSGDFLDGISEINKEMEFDFIFMGSHGTSGEGDWLIGSNTQKVVRKLHENILVIKRPIGEIVFKNILFATGLSTDDRQVFRRVLEILKPFGVEHVDILAVNATGFFSSPSTLMRELLKEFEEVSCEHYPSNSHYYPDYSVEAGIRHYVGENPVDLIVMSNHVRKPLKRIFFGSTVEMVINQIDIPVLSIDFE